MNNVNNKADTHYLKPLPLSQIPKPKVPKVDATKNKYQPYWQISFGLRSIAAILSINLYFKYSFLVLIVISFHYIIFCC